jgi:hypothetical protein
VLTNYKNTKLFCMAGDYNKFFDFKIKNTVFVKIGCQDYRSIDNNITLL